MYYKHLENLTVPPKMALSKEEIFKEQKELATTLRIKFCNCHPGALQRFCIWVRFMYPELRINETQVRRMISPKHLWQGELSYKKMLDIYRLSQEFFTNIDANLNAIAHLLPKTELDKVRLAL